MHYRIVCVRLCLYRPLRQWSDFTGKTGFYVQHSLINLVEKIMKSNRKEDELNTGLTYYNDNNDRLLFFSRISVSRFDIKN